MIGNLNIANSNRKDTNIKFTKDQEIAVHELIEFLAQPWDDKKFINALCGAGGTGKTFVIKYVINNCKWSGGVIGCALLHIKLVEFLVILLVEKKLILFKSKTK